MFNDFLNLNEKVKLHKKQVSSAKLTCCLSSPSKNCYSTCMLFKCFP